MSIENNNSAFMANLYVNGLPVVLNQQRLEQRLQDPRITRRERLDVEVALVDRNATSYLTVADHEDETPLLLKFALQGRGYVLRTILRGAYDGFYITIEGGTHHLSVSDTAGASYFSISKHAVENAKFDDLQAGPAYVQLVSKRNGEAVYMANNGGKKYFMDVDPNPTGHDAFNHAPVSFVLKLVDQSASADQ